MEKVSWRNAFRKLGSAKIYKALGHSQKSQISDNQDDFLVYNSAAAFASVAVEGKGISKSISKQPTNDHFLSLGNNNVSSIREFEAPQSPSQKEAWETADLNIPSELSSDRYHELPAKEVFIELPAHEVLIELPVPDILVELPSDRSSAFLPLSLQDYQTEYKILDTDSQYFPMISTSEHISSELFATPLMDLEIRDPSFKWHMNQKLQPHAHASRPRTPNKELKASKSQNLSIDTSASLRRTVATSKSGSSTSPFKQLLSSPSTPEILSYEPVVLLKQLRSVFWNTCFFKYSQLSRLLQTSIGQEIINRRASPEELFISGWEAVRKVLNGQLPQSLWSLFSLAQLAFACGLVVWENEIKHQFDELLDDLKVWSFALRYPHDRLSYQDVIERMFSNQDRSSKRILRSKYNSPSSSSSDSTSKHPDPLSLDSSELLIKLQDGVVIRLCLQLLSTFEFLHSRIEYNNHPSAKVLPDPQQTVEFPDCGNGPLIEAVIQPLYAIIEFRDFSPVFDEAIKLRYRQAWITSRQLELFLICHARYFIKDHYLYLRFCRTVAAICSKASSRITGTDIRANDYLLQDIDAIYQCQRDLASMQSSPSLDKINKIQKPQGISMASPDQQVAYVLQTNLDCHNSRSQHGRYQTTQLTSSTSNTTASTATSNQGQPICTPSTATSSKGSLTSVPVSSNSFSPATIIDSNLGASMDTIHTKFSAFKTPATTTDPESMPWLPCQFCHTVFKGREQYRISNWRRHMKEQHDSQSKPVVCKICQMQFRRRHNLDIHMIDKHAEVRD